MEERNIKITIETAERLYNGSDEELKALAIQTYPELNKPKWAEKWYDLKEVNGFYVNSMSEVKPFCDHTKETSKNTVPTEEQAEAILALCQLLQLRHEMVGDWYPSPNEVFFYLQPESDSSFGEYISAGTTRPLSFKDEEQVHHFIKHHKSLLNKARILL